MPKYTQPRKTWQYTTDFKIKAVKLSQQDGLQVKQVAEGLNVHPFMLSRWRKECREGKTWLGAHTHIAHLRDTKVAN